MSKKKLIVSSLVILATAFFVQQQIRIWDLPTEFEISGKIDECCCESELLKDTNNKIVDLTNSITETPFFRYFRVNLDKECPFWVQNLLCQNPGQCTVCECDENEVPLPFRFNKTSEVSTMDRDFMKWAPEKPKQVQWHAEDRDNEKGVFVDLMKNPEKFTGYQGQRIWNTIYNENCFKGNLEDMCLEERLLYRIISGMHTSISTQLTEHYGEKFRTKPNMKLFFEKVGDYPERIENLYFAYSVLLRAINRAADYIREYKFDTANFEQDIKTKQLVNQLLDITTSNCNHAFDESEIFSDITKVEVKDRFIQYFHNISMILDCVECEVCKVYSKMQTYGIAASLKILFSEKLEGTSEINLKRNELIALINTFNKFSTSLRYIDQMHYRKKSYQQNFLKDMLILIPFTIGGLWLLLKVYRSRVTKVTTDLKTQMQNYNTFDKSDAKTEEDQPKSVGGGGAPEKVTD